MRVFLAGATGVIGRRLLPRLLEAGHDVTAMTRRDDRAAALREAGAVPAVCDVFDAEGLRAAVERAAPEVVLHELTDLPPAIDPRKMEEQAGGQRPHPHGGHAQPGRGGGGRRSQAHRGAEHRVRLCAHG